MDYDVLILGGGILGCAVAYELSKYNLNIALVEKDFDIADDISFVNTSIVYDGSEIKDDATASLEMLGNSLLDDISKKFKIPFKRTPSLIIAEDEEDLKYIEEIYNRAKRRGIKDVHIIDNAAAKDIESRVPGKIKKALYSRSTGVISPYDLAIAYGEVAYDNGVNFKMEEIVIDVQKMARGFRVTTNKSRYSCRVVINTISTNNYTIDSNKPFEVEGSKKSLSYISLEAKPKTKLTNILFTPSKNNNLMYSIPSLNGGVLSGIVSDNPIGFHTAFKSAARVIKYISKNDINSFFQSEIYFGSIKIDDEDMDKGYIRVIGNSHAKITVTPAIAMKISEAVTGYLNCGSNNNFIDKRREFYKFKNMTKEEKNELIKMDKRYGKVICLCNQVTEGEIVDSIRRPLGARTIEGIKRRTGAGVGSCHGAYCTNHIISILARETDKNPMEIVDDSKNSNLLNARIKEFDDI